MDEQEIERHAEAIASTATHLVDFAKVVAKVKAGCTADANVQLNRKECRSLVWGLQLLRTNDQKE